VAQSPQMTMDPLQMLMAAADRIGDAVVEGVGSLVGFAAEHAPSAVGATVGAASSLASGINEAANAAISPLIYSPEPAASASQFASLDLGDLGGLKSCSLGECTAADMGQFSAQFTSTAQQRDTGFSLSA
jgi:hypothetical protein